MARHRSSLHKKDDFAASPKPSSDPFQPRPFADPAVDEIPHAPANSAPPVLDKLVTPPPRSAPIQPKLTIGAPGDRYEQEADRVASQVVRQIHAPQINAAVQREAIEDDELQMKPDSLQREAIEDDEELQMRPATEAVEGGLASEPLEAGIHQARGSGQALDSNLQRQMGQALGADFSGVTIHTDSQSDRLNRSIQAKAFTTGQDIFFRQGAYQPSSQNGQELIAHELTHVVQQNHGMVQRNFDEIVQRVTIEEIDEDESLNTWQPPQEIRQPSTPLMLTDRPWSEIEAQQNQKTTNHNGVTIEEIDEDESLNTWQPPQEIRQPSTPLMLTDRPWSEIEKEQSQLNDPRYQKKLKEISPKAPQSVSKLGFQDPVLEEHFKSHTLENFRDISQHTDPRYQEKLKKIRSKDPQVTDQGYVKRQVLQRETEIAKRESESQEAAAKEEIKKLNQDDKTELKQILVNENKKNKEPKETLGFYTAKIKMFKGVCRWTAKRLERRKIVDDLKREIDNITVPGRFSRAFESQAALVHQGKVIQSKILSIKDDGVIQLQTNYREALQDLVEQHRKVYELDRKGVKYGAINIQDLMIAVDAIISRPDFNLIDHASNLDKAIDAFNQALTTVTSRSQERMGRAQKAEDKLNAHSTVGQDSRGKKEEQEALKKINTLFTETQSKIKQENRVITDSESYDLFYATDILDSYQDRDKERQAHDLKATYEAAPYFLDDKISKIVHEERHIVEGKKTYKTINQLKEDYKKEVDAQYKASKELWCKHLGYSNGNGNARVTNNIGQYEGVPGHHSVFIGPYTDIVNARNKNASESDSQDRTADELMDIFYPTASTSGAHYTLETSQEPKPHAYRGGETRPGAKYQADFNANNVRWQQAETYMKQQQVLEETRVRDSIQHALDDHMKVIHRKDPNRRKPK